MILGRKTFLFFWGGVQLSYEEDADPSPLIFLEITIKWAINKWLYKIYKIPMSYIYIHITKGTTVP